MTRALDRTWRALMAVFSLTVYALFAPFGYLAFMGLSLLPTRDPQRRARLLLRIQQLAFRLLHGWMHLTRIERWRRVGFADAIPDGPCVVVATHPTLTDFTALAASIPRLVTVVKPALYQRWWLRPLLAGSACIQGGDGDPLGARRVIDDAVVRLRAGFRVLVFPEGTRSPPGQLHPFGRAAFEIACLADVPVIPIHVLCTPVWMSKETPIFPPPSPCPLLQLTALPAVEPAWVGHDSRALRRGIEATLRAYPERISAARDASQPVAASAAPEDHACRSPSRTS